MDVILNLLLYKVKYKKERKKKKINNDNNKKKGEGKINTKKKKNSRHQINTFAVTASNSRRLQSDNISMKRNLTDEWKDILIHFS